MPASSVRSRVITLRSTCPATSIPPLPLPFRPMRAAGIITRQRIMSSVTLLIQRARRQDYPVNPFDRLSEPVRALLLCFVLVTICYGNSLSNAFILDDILIVAANERIRHIHPIQFFFEPYWGDLNHAGIYRPLTIFSFSLEYPVWRVWAPGYRLVNLLLHTLNGWLVYL